MKPSYLLLPQEKPPPQNAGIFAWRLDNGPEVLATLTSFRLGEFPPESGEKYWALSGSTGMPAQGNYFSFQIILEYQRGPLDNITFKLDGKLLSMTHVYSIPAPEGFYGIATAEADSGQVTLSLDPVAGTIKGHFESVYRTLRRAPKGHFNLTRIDLSA